MESGVKVVMTNIQVSDNGMIEVFLSIFTLTFGSNSRQEEVKLLCDDDVRSIYFKKIVI